MFESAWDQTHTRYGFYEVGCRQEKARGTGEWKRWP